MENVRHMNPHGTADPDGPSPEDTNALDAERTVLGGCMHYPKEIPAVAAIITGADFHRPAHETVWNALLTLHTRGEPTDPISLARELEKTGDLKRIGGASYLHTCAQWAMPSPDYYAEQIRARADLRAEEELGRRIIQRATEPGAEPGQAVTFIDDYLNRQRERAAGRSGDPVEALLAELLDTHGLNNMPALEPLVGDFLHLDSLARVVGPSGHMKSFMTIDWAGHVGTGMKWHGHYTRQGTVIYLVAEGARGIRKRVRAWEQHYGVQMDNVLFLPRPVQAMSPEWDTLIEACHRLDPALIIIDTQARISVGVEENSAKELGLVVDRMEQLRAKTGACVLVIHHTGHVGEHGRGSSSAKGALQSELHISKKGDRARNTIVTMKIGKQKDDEQGSDLQFGLKVIRIDGEAKPNGDPVTSVVLESLNARPDLPAIGTPQWLVRRLDAAGVPLSWGSPRVIKWCAEAGIQMRKDKIEEAIRIRKRRDTFDEVQDLPPNLPPSSFNETPPDHGGTPGDLPQNPRSNLPPQPGGGPGDAPSKPPSPRSPSREGGGEGEPEENTPRTTPHCRICHHPMDPDWATRGYDTCLGCDPATGSHPPTNHPTPNPPEEDRTP